MSSSPPLPTPRQLLTSILNAISRIPATGPEQQQQRQRQAEGHQAAATSRGLTPLLAGGHETQPTAPTAAAAAANPLRLMDPAHRPLFTTLHVLFPSLLLPALDLLDRGLVTRLALEVGGDGTGEEKKRVRGGGDDVEALRRTTPQQQQRQPSLPSSLPSPSPSPSPVYLVRSAQKPIRRPFGGGGGDAAAAAATSTQGAYVVQTAAWNCTCAAFAFSAFPSAAGWSSLPLGRAHPTGATGRAPSGLRIATAGDEGEGGEPGVVGVGPAGWQFGGLSYDGCGGSVAGDDVGDGDGEAVPPCCKHLLACVLAERCDTTLGRYMVQRTIGREEMAGIFADI